MSNITLTATQRQTLLSLQEATSLFNQTQERLNTGKKVNSAADDAVAFFRSQSLYDRANNLGEIKSNIDQSIQTLNTAETAVSAVEGMLQQLKAIVDSARSASQSERTSDTQQFTTLANQMAQLVLDATYQGLNLLTSSNAALITQFSDRTAATLSIPGYNLIEPTGGNRRSLFTQTSPIFTSQGALVFSALVGDSTGAGGSPGIGAVGFSQLSLTASAGSPIPGSQAAAIFSATAQRIDNAVSQLQAIAEALGTNTSILTERSSFTANYTNVLTNGGDALTLADLNTEAANSQSLTLRQQLGIQSLTVSGQMNQSVLQLLK